MSRRRGGESALLAPILALASALGLWAIAAPFLAPAATAARRGATDAVRATARSEDAPLLVLTLLALCLVVVVAALETRRLDARRIAALGVLLGVNTVLRLIPGPGGFSAVFLLPILTGYVLGSTFGFLLGTLTMATSAMLVQGMGPWLPFQMLAAGWVGLVSGWLPELGGGGRRAEIAMLAAWGAVAGIFFGVVVDLWFWPYVTVAAGGPEAVWQPGEGLAATAGRFTLFYLATSLWWDLGRAGGNLVLIAAAGTPLLVLLRRFARRLSFTVAAPAGGEPECG